MRQGVITSEAALKIDDTIRALVKKVVPHTNSIIENMNVPTHALYAPIAADWVKYNEGTNGGEVLNARMWELIII